MSSEFMGMCTFSYSLQAYYWFLRILKRVVLMQVATDSRLFSPQLTVLLLARFSSRISLKMK